MKTIYKYPVKITDAFTVDLPVGAEILTVQMQNDEPCMWVLVELEPGIRETRAFRIYGTGHMVNDKDSYIGTFQQHDGRLVWHLFEVNHV